MQRCVIIGNANINNYDKVRKYINQDDFFVFCDGGLKHRKDLGVEPNECVFIGDSGMDAATAVNAGCTGIGVLWGFREEDELIQNGANYIVHKPCEILEVIK